MDIISKKYVMIKEMKQDDVLFLCFNVENAAFLTSPPHNKITLNQFESLLMNGKSEVGNVQKK